MKMANHTQTIGDKADSTLNQYDYITLISLTLETFIGTLVNSFIVVVNVSDLMNHRDLNSFDLILACLGMSRLWLQWLMLAMYFKSIVNVENWSEDSSSNYQYTWLFFSNSSLWLATWLSVLYCVRIANMQNSIFNLLKKHFDKLLPWFIVASVVISSICSSPLANNWMENVFYNNRTFSMDSNNKQFVFASKNFESFTVLCAMGSLVPFLIFCTAAWLVVSSVLKHVQKMKEQERTGYREPSLKAHYCAVMSIGFFFFFYLLYMVCFNVNASGTQDSPIVACYCAITMGAYPSIHSLFLVYGNNKLKHIVVRFLQNSKCYSPEAGQIETVTM